METCDILTATQQLEESGMDRSEAESVVRTVQSMVAPLATDAKLEAFRGDVKSEFEAFRGEVKSEFEAVRAEIKSESKAVRDEMESEFKSIRSEMESESKLVRKELEATEHKLTAKMHALATTQTWRLVGAVFLINSIFFTLQQVYG